MRKWMWLISLVFIIHSPISFAAQKALILDITGPISPATQDYIHRGMAYAQKNQAAAIILQLNTPGGLDSAMRAINQMILASPIPVISYVYPAGARSASAGVFIMYASNVSAMASGTNMGAASPVSLLGNLNSKKLSTTETKVVNDASAYIRSLAQLTNKNAAWGEQAVRQALSISASEAKQLKVINVIADSYPELLHKINNLTITLKGTLTQLNTHDMTLENMPPDSRYQLLSYLTNPNIAYLLLLIAIYGLFFEISAPGLILPGIIGSIALLLVLYSFQLMPINYAGLTLVLIGMALMVFEVSISSFGAIGIGGVIAFIFGSIMLFNISDANYRIAWLLIFIMSVLSVGFFVIVATLAFRSQRKSIVTGREGLIGTQGIVLSVDNHQITVRVLGEMWAARASVPLHKNDTVTVIKVDGLILHVKPIIALHSQKELGE